MIGELEGGLMAPSGSLTSNFVSVHETDTGDNELEHYSFTFSFIHSFSLVFFFVCCCF